MINLGGFFLCRRWQHRWECWTAGWASTGVTTRGWLMSSPASRRSTWVRESCTGDMAAAVAFPSWPVVFILRLISLNRSSTRLQDHLEALPPLNHRSTFTRVESPMRRWRLIKVHAVKTITWPVFLSFAIMMHFCCCQLELQAWDDTLLLTSMVITTVIKMETQK